MTFSGTGREEQLVASSRTASEHAERDWPSMRQEAEHRAMRDSAFKVHLWASMVRMAWRSLRGLTFEVRRDRRRRRQARRKDDTHNLEAGGWLAVGPRLDRGVRPRALLGVTWP